MLAREAVSKGGERGFKRRHPTTPCRSAGSSVFISITCESWTRETSSRGNWPRTWQPVGTFGELWLGGVQVARGYLKRPEKTAETFISVGGTGDRVRWYAEGGDRVRCEIEFDGRIDSQVKVARFSSAAFCLLFSSDTCLE